MNILLDLDGTLVDTNASRFDAIKYGRERSFALEDIPIIAGALEFVEAVKQLGHSVTIISDSHYAYVGPVSEKIFGAQWLALSEKPNTLKLSGYLERTFKFPLVTFAEEFIFVGDTWLDVQLARGLSLPSVLLFRGIDEVPHDPYYNEEEGWARRCKMGATHNCSSFGALLEIIVDPAEQRLVLEDPLGTASAHMFSGKNCNDAHTLIRGLGRQQQGPCDAYGAIDRYKKFGSEHRTDDFLAGVAADVSRYLREQVMMHDIIRWDLITCVADKSTTKPPRKMAKLLHALDVDLPREELFTWLPEVTGSIRHEKHRTNRMEFVKRFVRLENYANLTGKNIIVIDDQYTTGATAVSHVDMLLKVGVQNVLFIALFYLIDDVAIEKICPRCGQQAKVKYGPNHSKFYSCVPARFGGDGCGWTENI